MHVFLSSALMYFFFSFFHLNILHRAAAKPNTEETIEVATKSQPIAAQNEMKVRIRKYGLTGTGLKQ